MNNNTKNRKRLERKDAKFQPRLSMKPKVAASGCKDGLSLGDQKRIFYGV